MAEILKGAPVAEALTENLIPRAEILKSKNAAKIIPTLAILRVGEKAGDVSYENGAVRRCGKIGIDVRKFSFPENCSGKEILDSIREINNDESVHGCLMLRPLPDKKIEEEACKILSPSKDSDCITRGSLAKVFTGFGEGYAPCTAEACIELMKHYEINPSGKKIAVIGRSLVIGKPVAMMLLNLNATVTICHSKTENLEDICKNSDIVIAAIGKAKFLDKKFFAPKQIIIDVGINLDENGKLCGDVNFDEAVEIVKAVTPVPGGVGAVTTAVLAKHVIEEAEEYFFI